LNRSTAYVTRDETVATYGAALASLVSLMLARLAREAPGMSREVATAYRSGELRLRLVTTLAHGVEHELALNAVDKHGNEETLATVVVNAAAVC
jgi:hypothetical protein